MVVNATMDLKVDVSVSEALSVIKDYFGLINETDITILDNDNLLNKCGKKAIYKIVHHLHKNEYVLLTKDKDKVDVLEAFQLLENFVKNNKKLF